MIALAVYLLIGLAYFAPAFAPGVLLYGTDYLQGALPIHRFVADEIAHGRLPVWIPQIAGGVPLFANPGSTFYPLHFLLALLLPIGKVLPAVLALQVAVGGAGMRWLAREYGCRPSVAFLAGLAYALTGLTLSWVYAGHDGRIIVATLAPGALAALRRGTRTGERRAFLCFSLITAAALLSFQLQSVWYLLLAAVGLSARRWISCALAIGLAFALAAFVLIPFARYAEHSTRGAERGHAFAVAYSASWRDVFGLLVPAQAGSTAVDPHTGELVLSPYRGENALKLHSEYLGGFVWAALALCACALMKRAGAGRIAALAALFVTLALGEHTPLYRVYAAVLPGLSRFRAPDLALYMVALLIVLLASLALEHWLERPASERHALAPMIVVSTLLLLAWNDTGARGGYIRSAAVFGAAAIGVWLLRSRARFATAALALLIVLDQGGFGRRFFYLVPERDTAAEALVAFLAPKLDGARVFVLPGAEPGGNRLMRAGIDLLTGEHSSAVQRYVDLTGVRGAGLPERPAVRAALCSAFILSPQPLDGFEELGRSDGAILYRDRDPLPRARLVPRVRLARTGQESLSAALDPAWDPRSMAVAEADADLGLGGALGRSSATITRRSATRMEIETQAEGAGLLVVADTYSDGWSATIDGVPAPLLITDHALRGVVVDGGTHAVALRYAPPGLLLGSLVSLAALLVCAARWRRR